MCLCANATSASNTDHIHRAESKRTTLTQHRSLIKLHALFSFYFCMERQKVIFHLESNSNENINTNCNQKRCRRCKQRTIYCVCRMCIQLSQTLFKHLLFPRFARYHFRQMAYNNLIRMNDMYYTSGYGIVPYTITVVAATTQQLPPIPCFGRLDFISSANTLDLIRLLMPLCDYNMYML